MRLVARSPTNPWTWQRSRHIKGRRRMDEVGTNSVLTLAFDTIAIELPRPLGTTPNLAWSWSGLGSLQSPAWQPNRPLDAATSPSPSHLHRSQQQQNRGSKIWIHEPWASLGKIWNHEPYMHRPGWAGAGAVAMGRCRVLGKVAQPQLWRKIQSRRFFRIRKLQVGLFQNWHGSVWNCSGAWSSATKLEPIPDTLTWCKQWQWMCQLYGTGTFCINYISICCFIRESPISPMSLALNRLISDGHVEKNALFKELLELELDDND